MIGIGITTRNRRDVLALCLDHHRRFPIPNSRIVVVDDASDDPLVDVASNVQVIRHETQQGIAASKNACLRSLQTCEHVFLFDDDCFPKYYNWHEPFVRAHTRANIHHALHIVPSGIVQPVGDYQINEVTLRQYTHCGGVMLFLTQEAIRVVGGFNPEYKIYGFEHAGYTHRIHRAELMNNLPPYIGLPGTQTLFHAMDWDGVPPGSDVVFHSSIDLSKRDTYIDENRPVYMSEGSGPLYFPL